MPSRHGSLRRSPLAIVALAVYALLVLGGPFFHIDGVSSGHSPAHCAVCAASHSIPAIEDPRLPALDRLAVCGAPSRTEFVVSSLALTPRVTGRSPPA